MTLYLKHPQARLDYLVDWGGALDGRSVAAVDWAVAPAEAGGLAVAAQAIDGTRIRVTLDGGVAGRVYRVTAHATFSDAREDARALTLRVDAR